MKKTLALIAFIAPFWVSAQDLGFDMNTEVDEAKGIATEGRSQSQGSLGDNSAEDTLGVESQGTTDSRSGHATYGQELEGYVRCPSGEFGAKSSMQQAWVQCRKNSGASLSINYCEPTNSNDTAYSDCSNGEEFSTNANVGGVASSFVGSNAKIAIENCTADDSDYFCGGDNAYKVILSRSGSFSGGEGQANAQGNDRLNDPNGPVANTQGSGVYDQDGKPMLSGTNPNSGTAAAEMISASQTSQCAKDVGVSLDQGEPVFTCGSDEEAGTFTSGEDGGCEETERCTAWEDEQVTRTETCTQSTNLSQPECRVQYPVRQCQRSRIGGTETCSETTAVDVRVRREQNAASINDSKTASESGLIPDYVRPNEVGKIVVTSVINKALDKILSVINNQNVYPATIKWGTQSHRFSRSEISQKSPVKSHIEDGYRGADYYGACYNISIYLMGSSGFYNASATCKVSVSATGSCSSGFDKKNGKCVENVDVSGYSRFETTNRSNYTYAYYKKETTSNACGQYE